MTTNVSGIISEDQFRRAWRDSRQEEAVAVVNRDELFNMHRNLLGALRAVNLALGRNVIVTVVDIKP